MTKLVLFFINIFDFFYKKKVLKFLKKDLKLNSFKLFIDIGGHHGETMNLFCKNFPPATVLTVSTLFNNSCKITIFPCWLTRFLSLNLFKIGCIFAETPSTKGTIKIGTIANGPAIA